LVDFQETSRYSDIGAVADVRSSPASRLPHFNRAALKDRLNAAGIAYLFLGLELGGHPTGGVPDYELMAASPLFAEGIEQIERIAPRTRLALMCSEHEPLTCHRCLLVGRRLVERGVAVAHILRNGTVESNEDTEDRLLALGRQTERDLFVPRADRVAAAYRAQGLRIAGVR
jgi:uncharacterized protein (DUF488 family)